MLKNYKIINPGGNITALVNGINYTKEEKREINDSILAISPKIEQVGFLDEKKKILQMAGGEFCLNATRCAIWEILNGKDGKTEIAVSGCKEKLCGGIEKGKVYVNISVKKNIIKRGKLNIVTLDGITHIVLDEKESTKYIKALKEDEENTKYMLKEIMQNMDCTNDAVGIILLERDESVYRIYPIVWVKTIDTLYYETACGSGSLATFIYLNDLSSIKNIELLQPSNYTISIKLDNEEKDIKYCVVEGIVKEEKDL